MNSRDLEGALTCETVVEASLESWQAALGAVRLELRDIQSRNLAKEVDKAFEVSYTRTISIMALTYAALFLYMRAIGVPRAALNAVVPSIGFHLSTWSLPLVKRVWLVLTHRHAAS